MKRFVAWPLLGAALILGSILAPGLVAADTAVQSATVSMTDTGFTPPSITIPAGGTITWKNDGDEVHTATSIPGVNPSFDTGGVSPKQSASKAFTAAGIYYYTSSTECLHNISLPRSGFSCELSYVVNVVPPGTPISQPAPVPAPPAPATAPAAPPVTSGPAANATVTITDKDMSPATVSILLNGSVTWKNQGKDVHTATSTADSNASMPAFDSGGIGGSQQATVGFTTPGTYLYTSAVDCLSGGQPAFTCGPYTIVVSSTAVPQPTPVGGIPTPTPNPLIATGNATITIDENKGFQPNPLNVKVGQTVSWFNAGQQTHSVVLNQGDPLKIWWMPLSSSVIPLDSGGISPNQVYSFTFTTPGAFYYHSSTDPIYNHDNSCSCLVTAFIYNGLVNVTPDILTLSVG